MCNNIKQSFLRQGSVFLKGCLRYFRRPFIHRVSCPICNSTLSTFFWWTNTVFQFPSLSLSLNPQFTLIEKSQYKIINFHFRWAESLKVIVVNLVCPSWNYVYTVPLTPDLQRYPANRYLINYAEYNDAFKPERYLILFIFPLSFCNCNAEVSLKMINNSNSVRQSFKRVPL